MTADSSITPRLAIYSLIYLATDLVLIQFIYSFSHLFILVFQQFIKNLIYLPILFTDFTYLTPFRIPPHIYQFIHYSTSQSFMLHLEFI